MCSVKAFFVLSDPTRPEWDGVGCCWPVSTEAQSLPLGLSTLGLAS